MVPRTAGPGVHQPSGDIIRVTHPYMHLPPSILIGLGHGLGMGALNAPPPPHDSVMQLGWRTTSWKAATSTVLATGRKGAGTGASIVQAMPSLPVHLGN